MARELYDHEAERIVLGCMMTSPEAVEVVTDRYRITSETYHQPRHGTIHAHLVAAWAAGEPTDPVALTHRLAEAGELSRAGGTPYLAELMAAVPVAAMVGHYAAIVADLAARRRLAEAGRALARAADIPDPDVRAKRVAQVRDLLDTADTAEDAEAVPVHPVPAYPAEAVPDPLRELVTSARGLPAGLVGGAGLAALAGVCPTAELQVADGWTERPIVWVALIAPRGAGKSPAMDLALAPIREADAQVHRVYRDQVDAWKEAPRSQRDDPPPDPTRIVDDTTMEMLARRLDSADGAAFLVADELTSLLGSLDRYRTVRGADRGRLLSLWTGAQWRFQRVSDKVDILIPRPTVSVVGGIQPALHWKLGGDEDGMRPRWSAHVAALNPSAAGTATPPASWSETLTRLHGTPAHRTWTLDTRTYRLWSAARARWKAAAGAGESASVSGALIKADILTARYALALAEGIEPGKGGPIPPEAMTGAIAITDYVVDGWRSLGEGRTLALSRRDEKLDRAVDQLAAWLRDHGGRAIRRDLLLAHVAGCRTAKDLDALLARYEETYPGHVCKEKAAGAGGGRKPEVVYAPGARNGA